MASKTQQVRAELQYGPGTSRRIAERLGMHLIEVAPILTNLVNQGEAVVVGKVKNGNGRPMNLYVATPQEELEARASAVNRPVAAVLPFERREFSYSVLDDFAPHMGEIVRVVYPRGWQYRPA